MTDVPEWDHDPPKTASMDARVRDLRLRYRLGRDDLIPTLLHFYADCVRDDTVPEAFLALLKADKTDLDGAQDHRLSILRASEDLEIARQAAAEETEES